MSSLIHHKHPLPTEVFFKIFRAYSEFDNFSIVQAGKKVGYFLQTLFLFTRSDWKRLFVHSQHSLQLQALLQFNCANQAYSGDEDIINKPWRPVPSRRITPRQTIILRWIMFPINLAFSYSIGRPVLYTTLLLTSAEILYNEMGWSKHPLLKNVLNLVGYGGFKTGATLIASPSLSLDQVAVQALILSCSVIFTTIHAQDFPDCEGDKLAGRHTLPILFPNGARVYITAILVAWSIALSLLWGLGVTCTAVFVAAGTFIAWRFYTKREVKVDEKTIPPYPDLAINRSNAAC